ncbi:23S rRNA (guanosine(2251)-2'-O)-methyltransferase RlmB [Catenulispora yoronensis]|uniref:23S rRNA (Guanosine(2251)-2'-O)-methyltransferase RlmB n=1 Tax=Catenulispora yoronensis TaxID=450799 RepID=A0ABN2TLF6_9ACTN
MASKGGGLGGRANKPGASNSRKGAQKGSGGQRRQGLEGRGPTPKAEERTGHPAKRRATSAAKRAAVSSRGGAQRGGAVPKSVRRAPGKDGPEQVAGRNSVVEALRANIPAKALYVAQYIDADDRVRESMKLATDQGVPLLEAPRHELDRMTNGTLHQGLMLVVPAYEYAYPDDLLEEVYAASETPLFAALDGVTDPRNLGAVLRSVAAFGGHGVIVPERRAAGMTAGAWKAAAGAGARVPVARAGNLTRALEAYQKQGVLIAGLAADGAVALHELEAATDPLCLVIGSEGKGMSRLVSELCDVTVSIPIASSTESLNAGVAAGIALYEVNRRRAEARG